jgi:hypothetical protein
LLENERRREAMFDFDVRDRGKGETVEGRWYWEEEEEEVTSDDVQDEQPAEQRSLWEAELEAMVERMGGQAAAEGLWAAEALLAMEDGAAAES